MHYDNMPKNKLLEIQFVLSPRVLKEIDSLHMEVDFLATSILKFNKIAESLNPSTVVHQSSFFILW